MKIISVPALLLSAATLFVLTAHSTVPGALAREYAHSDTRNDQHLPTRLDESKIKAFARAYSNVSQIHRKYELRLANAGPEEQYAIRQEAAREIDREVENQGLSTEQYNSIARAMVTNASLKEQIADEISSL